MTLTTTNNKKIKAEFDTCKSESISLRKLFYETQDSLFIDISFDYNSKNRFSRFNKGKYDPFGYEYSKNKSTNNFLLHKKNRLRHKLNRIQKEFNFVENNILSYQQLTPREKEIIQLLTRGKNNPEIANYLCISRLTVEQHRKHINQKLKIESFSKLIHFSYAFDLI